MNELLALIISAIFINNYVLSRFLGICPFIGVSRSSKPAFAMGLAVTIVMTLVSLITWPIYQYLLVPYSIEYMYIVIFILVIASFVQFLDLFLRRYNPILFKAFGIYLPLITTNCAILGAALLNINQDHNFIQSIIFGLASGLGFMLALILMSAIRERVDLGPVPYPFKGIAIAFLIAAMMSIAFLPFGGFSLG